MNNRDLISPPYDGFQDRTLVLASQSPRRRQLLEWADLNFQVIVVPTDEHYDPELPVEEIPVHIARQKSFAINAPADSIVIAADTIVVSDGLVMGKPVDEDDAVTSLARLSGRVHQVITGVFLRGRSEISFSDITFVEFHELTEAEIRFYVRKYRPYDKAGAYGIQEWIGVAGIKSINGDFYNVMGLPVSRVLQALKSGVL
ncbi:MAG: septum formation protein Maf [Sphingobacteriales bacterium]|nr:MAG: septum formation protein Maf [Sphingobacteriales bacterium]